MEMSIKNTGLLMTNRIRNVVVLKKYQNVTDKKKTLSDGA